MVLTAGRGFEGTGLNPSELVFNFNHRLTYRRTREVPRNTAFSLHLYTAELPVPGTQLNAAALGTRLTFVLLLDGFSISSN